MEYLDGVFPGKPLWRLMDESGQSVWFAANAYAESLSELEARESPRAAWLFCQEEGYRLDALPRSAFEAFLDGAETLLKRNTSGPFFCGRVPSAADVVWAPLLERYAAQLPCLHRDLCPRGSVARWPCLHGWYEAMDKIPAYACRVKGDATSWRKLLFVDPWWPREDLWHPRDTVGPKGELLLSEDE
jgi:glutathione S-transferase